MMDNRQEAGLILADRGTTVKRISDVEVRVTRVFDAPAHIVFEAWSNPELFAQWWVPKSIGANLRSCQMDVRTGGSYRLEFGNDGETTFVFFGNYTDVVPPTRIVWTNEEGGNIAISTVTFVEKDGRTHLTFTETHPTKQALDDSLGGMEGTPEQFAQLDEMLVRLKAKSG
jgi:uncharacterized protein YndB with AHSA1/START domain